MSNYDYVPILIVAIDNDGNYIHIRKADSNKEYYCPCCGAVVKARAIKSNKVQPHFYHCEGSNCNEETIAHWIYKNWLFEKGCKFITDKDGIQYEFVVDKIEIEQSHNTKFGIYKPDITVTTSDGKVVYFEINYSNKKAVDDYFCKWDELKNDVIEVNIRQLINADLNNSTPIFDVIYSDGDYLEKYSKYAKRDTYKSTIGEYKKVISKEKCENQRQRFEKLDWFWVVLQKYRLGKVGKDEIAEVFKCLDFEDKYTCYNLTKRLRCIDLKNVFISIINNEFIDIAYTIAGQRIKNPSDNIGIKYTISITQQSIQIFQWEINMTMSFNGYKKKIHNYNTSSEFRSYDGIYPIDTYQDVENMCYRASQAIKKYDDLIENYKTYQRIKPYEGEINQILSKINEMIKKELIYGYSLNLSLYEDKVSCIRFTKHYCTSLHTYKLKDYSKVDLDDMYLYFYQNYYKKILDAKQKIEAYKEKIYHYHTLINECKNKRWKSNFENLSNTELDIIIELLNEEGIPISCYSVYSEIEDFYDINESDMDKLAKKSLVSAMNDLLECENYRCFVGGGE